MSKTAEVTDIYKVGDMYAKKVDFQRREYRVCWHGDWRNSPDLSAFPDVPGVTIAHITHSPEVDELWSKSQVPRYGADFHIRLLDRQSDDADDADDNEFPVCKVAVNDRQRRVIVDEFEMLRELASTDAPVVRVHPQPLVDGNGVFGFRMNQLSPIDPHTQVDKNELTKCLEQLHAKGIVHNDFHPSNVMTDDDGRIVIVDFGRAGRVGTTIPPGKRSPWWQAESYSFEADYISLKRFFFHPDG